MSQFLFALSCTNSVHIPSYDKQVPTVELECRDLVYGECFVRFHEPRTLILVNKSPVLTGLFRVVPQDPATYAIARVAPEPKEGQVRSRVLSRLLADEVFIVVRATMSGSKKLEPRIQVCRASMT